MIAQTLNVGTSSLAIALIQAYQRWISPYKGFRCAYGAHRKAASCSCFGLKAFQRNPPLKALGVIKKRLDLCRLAYEEHKDKRRRKREAKGLRSDAVEVADNACGAIDPFSCGDAAGGACDAGAGDACSAIGSCS